jgi:ABC-type phosphate transport system auxiliary subunit
MRSACVAALSAYNRADGSAMGRVNIPAFDGTERFWSTRVLQWRLRRMAVTVVSRMDHRHFVLGKHLVELGRIHSEVRKGVQAASPLTN